MNVITGQTIYFTNSSDLWGEPVVWFEWDFGDGNIDNMNWDTTHMYNSVGTYTAKLTVHTECGTCVPSTETIFVTDEEEVAGVGWLPIVAALAMAGAALILMER